MWCVYHGSSRVYGLRLVVLPPTFYRFVDFVHLSYPFVRSHVYVLQNEL